MNVRVSWSSDFTRFASAGAIALVTVAGIGASSNTKAAADGFAIVSCSSSLTCTGGANSSNGPGVAGFSAKGFGVVGTTKNVNNVTTTAGVEGRDLSKVGLIGVGVLGTSPNGVAVKGVGNTGVYGVSPGGGYGVSGMSQSNLGGLFQSVSWYGLQASSQQSIGLYAFSNGSTDGILGYSSGGNGIEGQAQSGDAVHAYAYGSNNALGAAAASGDAIYATSQSGLGAFISNANGAGADITGTTIGVIARSGSFPFYAVDGTGSTVFFIDSGGNVFYHGSLNSFAITKLGGVATAYASKTTSPTVEDSGSGRLENGKATVKLDPAFAQTIDPKGEYHVMLTPEADTTGLYIASKSQTAFVVRETMGGRGNFSFDYHVYAPALGHANERMTILTKKAAEAMVPVAKLIPQHPGRTTPPMPRDIVQPQRP